MHDLEPLPVVLLHGLIGSLDDPAIATALHPRLVFSPSLLGYGANADTAPATITLANQVEYVAQLVRTKFGEDAFIWSATPLGAWWQHYSPTNIPRWLHR